MPLGAERQEFFLKESTLNSEHECLVGNVGRELESFKEPQLQRLWGGL